MSFESDKKKPLYICSTYYHVLVTLAKFFTCEPELKICLTDHIPEVEKLEKNLNKVCQGICVGVFYQQEDNLHREAELALPWKRREYKKLVGKGFPVKLEDYGKKYIFHDGIQPAIYMVCARIHYNLVEDSLNTFQYLTKHRVNIDYIFAKNKLKLWLKLHLGIGIVPWGFSPYCDSIEVNQIEGIEIPKNKVIEKPRKPMFDSLTEANKKAIFDIFIGGSVISTDQTDKSTVLILTEALAVDKRLPSQERQIQMYKDIVSEFSKGDALIVIKPHPRDIINYELMFPDAIVISKNIPTEVMNYDKSLYFTKAVTVTSTAIEGISFVGEKIYKGQEFLKKYQ